MSIQSSLPSYTSAFPQALGTGLLIHTRHALDSTTRDTIADFIETFEATLSRFRADSLVTAMREATHGGTFTFPQWASPLFDLVDQLVQASQGALDPCVGDDLIRLGYDQTYRLTADANSWDTLGSVHGRATWHDSVQRNGTTLTTTGPVALDFGSCGKGFLVDCLSGLLSEDASCADWVIDAGGDLRIHTSKPITIALEDPSDTTQAVGTIALNSGACCASAPSRRQWQDTAGRRVHHILNALDGRPVENIAATWVTVDESASFPTALADGLTTALFVTSPDDLCSPFSFECALLDDAAQLRKSRGFTGVFFTD